MTTHNPMSSIVWFKGLPYVVNLAMCRKALVRRQVEGEIRNMTSLAAGARVSRSTASRMFSGRSTSLAAMLRVLANLHLEFGDVCQEATAADIAQWRREQEERQGQDEEQRRERKAKRERRLTMG